MLIVVPLEPLIYILYQFGGGEGDKEIHVQVFMNRTVP